MSEFTGSELVSRLISDFGYSEWEAKPVAEDLVTCTPLVKTAFKHWWNTGEIGDLEIQGYTVKQLMGYRNMNTIAAFLTLDWLATEPEKALVSLKRGYDLIK